MAVYNTEAEYLKSQNKRLGIEEEITLDEDLHTVMNKFHFKHRNRLVQKLIGGGYTMGDKKYPTLTSIDEEIDKDLEAIEKSIKKPM